MASIDVTIRRSNGMTCSASADVEDALVVDIASMLGALVFDASTAPTPIEGTA